VQLEACVSFQKRDKLSNTFFQWPPLEFLITGCKKVWPAGEEKNNSNNDLAEKYELFAGSVAQVAHYAK
jgi:hypothetical protein